MKATIEIDTDEPEKMIRAIEPDMGPSEKFDARLEAGRGKLTVVLESGTAGGLLAGINSVMRMIKTVKEVEEIE